MKFQRRKECNKFHFPIFYVELPKLRWVFHRSLGRVVGMHRFPGSQGACSHGRWNSVRCCIIQLERSGQPKCTKARRYAKCKGQKRSQRESMHHVLYLYLLYGTKTLRWVNPTAVRTGGGGHVQMEVHAGYPGSSRTIGLRQQIKVLEVMHTLRYCDCTLREDQKRYKVINWDESGFILLNEVS